MTSWVRVSRAPSRLDAAAVAILPGAAQGSVWTTTSAMSPIAGAARPRARRPAGGRRPATRRRGTASVRNRTRPASVAQQPDTLRVRVRCARARARSTSAVGRRVGGRVGAARAAAGARAARGGVCTSITSGRCADRPLDALGDLVRAAQVELGGELQVQRHAGRARRRSKIVMSCASLTSGSARAIASTRSRRSSPRLRGSTCTTTSLPGQRALDGRLDQVGRAVALDHGLARRDGHDDVGEVAPGGLAQAQPARARRRRRARRSRARRRLARLRGRAVHQHVGVLGDQPRARRTG